jgi:hypothetical protein
MTSELTSSLSKMIVNGNRLELPKDEQFTNYPTVKKALLMAGGKYLKCGFLFNDNAQAIKDRLVGGEAINDKKKFQFFSTPSHVIDLIINKADIDSHMSVLEPSAGQGAIVDAIIEAGAHPSMIELMPENIKVLNRKYSMDLSPIDFLTINPADHIKYERIVANPPFTKNQDVDHVLHMYKFLEQDGLLVSVMGKSWINGSQKKQLAFKEWLVSVNATVTDIDAGAFKESGTNIATVLVEIRKTTDLQGGY